MGDLPMQIGMVMCRVCGAGHRTGSPCPECRKRRATQMGDLAGKTDAELLGSLDSIVFHGERRRANEIANELRRRSERAESRIKELEQQLADALRCPKCKGGGWLEIPSTAPVGDIRCDLCAGGVRAGC